MSLDVVHAVDGQRVDRQMAQALGMKVPAECGFLLVPRDFGPNYDGLPYCAECYPEEARRWNRGKHRTSIDERREFPHYVYRCYDATDQLLYVGCTYNPPARMRQHRAEKRAWINAVVRTRLTVWPDRRKALDMERLAIETEAPIYNKAFNRKVS